GAGLGEEGAHCAAPARGDGVHSPGARAGDGSGLGLSTLLIGTSDTTFGYRGVRVLTGGAPGAARPIGNDRWRRPSPAARVAFAPEARQHHLRGCRPLGCAAPASPGRYGRW